MLSMYKHVKQTLRHKRYVAYYMLRAWPLVREHRVNQRVWIWRLFAHDLSKLLPVEGKYFAAIIDKNAVF